MTLDENCVVRRDPRTASRVLGGEAVILTPGESKIFSLNPVGSRIWELLAGQPTVSALIRTIHEEFEVGADQARRDVLEFLQALKDRELVEFVPAGTPETTA